MSTAVLHSHERGAVEEEGLAKSRSSEGGVRGRVEKRSRMGCGFTFRRICTGCGIVLWVWVVHIYKPLQQKRGELIDSVAVG